MSAKILIVEDDDEILESLSDVLRTAGYEVLTAKNGATGFETALLQTPDLILLDMLMPVINGQMMLEMLETVRKTRPPVIVMTAVRSFREWAENHDTHFCTKPFSIDEILASVRAALIPSPPEGAQPVFA